MNVLRCEEKRCVVSFSISESCSFTVPAITGEQLVRAADVSVQAGGRGAFQPSVDSCAIRVFHLLLQKCASAEYQ